MDVLPLLDGCDVIDPMVNHKSKMTNITLFKGMDQRKRAAA